MEMGGQLHASVSLSLGKEALVPPLLQVWQAPEPMWMF
jgi:hypothetical protein